MKLINDDFSYFKDDIFETSLTTFGQECWCVLVPAPGWPGTAGRPGSPSSQEYTVINQSINKSRYGLKCGRWALNHNNWEHADIIDRSFDIKCNIDDIFVSPSFFVSHCTSFHIDNFLDLSQSEQSLQSGLEMSL